MIRGISGHGGRSLLHHLSGHYFGHLTESGPPPKAAGKWAGLLPTIPEGENYLFHTRLGGGRPLFGYRTRYWSFLLKLAKDEPSWTLQAHPGPATGPFHWANRPLTVQEMLRLQSSQQPGEWRATIGSGYVKWATPRHHFSPRS